jgi:hypothetical protein
VSKDEKLLVLVNMSKKDVNGYKITLSQGTLSNTYHVFPVVGEGTPPDLHSNAGGGFDAYQPGMTIPANGYIVLQLR